MTANMPMEPLAGLNQRLVLPLDDEARGTLCTEAAQAVRANAAFSMCTHAWCSTEDGAMRHGASMRRWLWIGRSPLDYPAGRRPADLAGTIAGYLWGMPWTCGHPQWEVQARVREVLGLALHEANALLHPDTEALQCGAPDGGAGWIARDVAADALEAYGRTGVVEDAWRTRGSNGSR